MKTMPSRKQFYMLAAISGIGSVAIAVLIGFLYPDSLPSWGNSFAPPPSPPTPILDTLSTLLYISYMYGFVLLGSQFHSRWIRISSIALMVLSPVYIIISLFNEAGLQNPFALDLIFSLTLSTAIVALGWNVLNLKSRLGSTAVWYGVFAMLSGTGIAFLLHPYVFMAIDMLAYIMGSAIFYRLARGRVRT